MMKKILLPFLGLLASCLQGMEGPGPKDIEMEEAEVSSPQILPENVEKLPPAIVIELIKAMPPKELIDTTTNLLASILHARNKGEEHNLSKYEAELKKLHQEVIRESKEKGKELLSLISQLSLVPILTKSGTDYQTDLEDQILKLIDEGAFLDEKDNTGSTPLHHVIFHYPPLGHHPAFLKALLSAGANPNIKDINGDTPLHIVSRDSLNPDIVTALLAAGADPNISNNKGELPMDLARNVEILSLLTQGMDLSSKDNREALEKAIFNGDIDVVQKLVEIGADPKVIYSDNSTLLHKAVRGRFYKKELVKLLLELGVDPAIKNKRDQTALDVLKDDYNYYEIVENDYELERISEAMELLEAAEKEYSSK